MKKLFLLLVSTCVLLLPVSAFAELKIGFAYQDLETEFWVAGHKAITETLRGKGITVLERNANESANRQLEQIKNLIVEGVDGLIVIVQDGESALTITGEANKAGVPIVIFNRPPANYSKASISVEADQVPIAAAAVEYIAKEAMKKGGKVTPLIMVGDLGDPNAVGRKKGFYQVINKYPDLFHKPVEVATKWDAATGFANLQSAMQANPDVDFIFTSSDFLFPQIKAVLKAKGKWQKRGHQNHVLLAGLDGDKSACKLIKQGYVDATGVQDLFAEAEMAMNALLLAIAQKEKLPKEILMDKGFALTAANLETREMDMWGCKLLAGN